MAGEGPVEAAAGAGQGSAELKDLGEWRALLRDARGSDRIGAWLSIERMMVLHATWMRRIRCVRFGGSSCFRSRRAVRSRCT